MPTWPKNTMKNTPINDLDNGYLLNLKKFFERNIKLKNPVESVYEYQTVVEEVNRRGLK